MSKYKIVFLENQALGKNVDWSRFEALGDFVSYETTLPEQVPERISDADIISAYRVPLGEKELAAAPHLKMIAVPATGFDFIDVAAAKKRNIIVTNVRGYSTDSVAQHVFALLLDLAGSITVHANAVLLGEWGRVPRGRPFYKRTSVEVHGKTLGVIGFGDIGRAVAHIGHGFGMNILAYNPRPKEAPGFAPFAFAALDELVAQSDFISLNCPLTPENREMVDRDFLAKMKQTAFLINTARGGLINEADLRRALEDGVIAGAGLDATTVEPLPESSPLFGAPNCLITPHIAWVTGEALARLGEGVLANIRDFVEGRDVRSVI